MINWDDKAERDLALSRAELIFTNWAAKGKIDVSEVARVLRGEYRYIVTFRRTRTANNANVRGYAFIEGVSSQEEADDAAEAYFPEELIASVLPEWKFLPKLYPKGLTVRIDKGGEVINGQEPAPQRSR